MSSTLHVGKPKFLMANGVLMLGLGMGLFALGSVMTNPVFEDSCYVVAILLTSLCLLITGAYYGALAIVDHRRCPISFYLLIGTLSIACWLILWLIQSATFDIPLLDLLAGFQGVFWGMWYMRLAFGLKAHRNKATLLCIQAATTSFLGVILATQSQISRLTSVTEVACYSGFLGVQILFSSAYLFRECEKEKELQPKQSPERDDIDINENSKLLVVD